LENFIKNFSENWKMGEKARSLMQFLGKLVFFFVKLEKIKTPPSPLSQAILTFWPRGGALQQEFMAAEGGFYGSSCSSAVGSQLPCNNLQTVNQVTHQS
jgi:hypothetical protein